MSKYANNLAVQPRQDQEATEEQRHIANQMSHQVIDDIHRVEGPHWKQTEPIIM